MKEGDNIFVCLRLRLRFSVRVCVCVKSVCVPSNLAAYVRFHLREGELCCKYSHFSIHHF